MQFKHKLMFDSVCWPRTLQLDIVVKQTKINQNIYGALNKKDYLMIIRDSFCYFCKETHKHML